VSQRITNLLRLLEEASAVGATHLDVDNLADYPDVVDALRRAGCDITFGFGSARVTLPKDKP